MSGETGQDQTRQAERRGDGRAYAGCAIPPMVYRIGVGWDPQPEVERLLYLARQAGLDVHSALELGCGTGRLLNGLCESVDEVVALDISPAVVEFARGGSSAEIIVGDMSDFALARRFDLIFTSANTIRHVHDDAAIERMWDCIADHLTAGGVFICDLELGIAAEAERVGKPAIWEIQREAVRVRVCWEVVSPPTFARRLTTIRWTFVSRGGARTETFSEEFLLRAYDATEFVGIAEKSGRLRCRGFYEPRDPYLMETSPAKATGRMIAMFALA